MILGDMRMSADNGNNIDIRIIKLSKWQVPKQKKTFDSSIKNSAYMALGHFDVIDVKKVEANGKHPFLQAYKNLFRHESTINKIYTTQELMVFTDVNEHFTVNKIANFWDKEGLLFFVSLIHVDNEDKIGEIVKRIREIFKGKNYIYYFSFDYSGIIIFAKDIQLSLYLDCIFRLNYDNSNKKIIRDSYSVYGLGGNKLKEYFKCIKDKGYDVFREMFGQEYGEFANEKLSVAVNVGINEFEYYKKFIDKLEGEKMDYKLFGRYDVSIVNDKADIAWIIYVQYLLNYDENEPYFSTYETFTKVTMGENNYKDGKKDRDEFLHSVCSDLQNLQKEFSDLLRRRPVYDGQYILPLCAVINSIHSISGNRFAEDFVLCMCKSFRDFILYLIDKLSCDDESNEMEFDQCYSEYFKGLNSLVNSAMHSERQFIQATAFNAIIYDIPSKIMAFYVAMINKLQSIIHMENDKRYTFFLTPSFSNQISVKIFSYEKEELPHDRLLSVTINEESLFNPHVVIRRMAHEIAHFEGDDLRERSDRKRKIKLTLVYIALSKILYKPFLKEDSFIVLGEEICNLLEDNIKLRDGKYNYSNDLLLMGEYIYLEFLGNKSIENVLEKNVENVIRNNLENEDLNNYLRELACSYLSGDAVEISGKISNAALKVLTNLVMKDVRNAVEYLNTEAEIAVLQGEIDNSVVTKMNRPSEILGEYTDVLVSIYSEAFADIHMVLLTGLSYSEYIKGFAEEESFDVTNLPKRVRDHARISGVSLIMYMTGVWRDVLDRKLDLSGESAELHNMIREKNCKVCCEIGEWVEEAAGKIRAVYETASNLIRGSCDTENISFDLKKLIDKAEKSNQYDFINLPFLDMNLFGYLFKCMKLALPEYQKKRGEIDEVKVVMNTVVAFEDVEKVFSVMCSEINKYKLGLEKEIKGKRE